MGCVLYLYLFFNSAFFEEIVDIIEKKLVKRRPEKYNGTTARPTETLAHRIAKHTGVDEVDVQYMFDNPQPHPSGVCWTWHGATGGLGNFTPMMRYGGKPTPVRRILVGHQSRVLCLNPFCVNPSHARTAQDRAAGPEPEPETPAGADEIEELLEMLAEGFTEAQLLTMYEPSMVTEALRSFGTPL